MGDYVYVTPEVGSGQFVPGVSGYSSYAGNFSFLGENNPGAVGAPSFGAASLGSSPVVSSAGDLLGGIAQAANNLLRAVTGQPQLVAAQPGATGIAAPATSSIVPIIIIGAIIFVLMKGK